MPITRNVVILVENGSVPADRRVWQHSLALTESGARVFVVCPQYPSRDEDRHEQREGVTIFRYPTHFSNGGVSGYVKEYADALKSMRQLVRRLTETQPIDVVHACNPPDVLLVAARSARRRGAAFIFDQHDLVPEMTLSHFPGHALLYRATRVAERRAYAMADVVLVTTDSYREVALGRGGKREEDVFLVRNAPNLAFFRPVEPDPALKRGAPYLIGFVGLMGPQDGVDHTLRALATLKQRRNDWHAVFVGEGEIVPAMQELARELGLGDEVEFTGWMSGDELITTLSTFDVCMAPNPKTPLNDVSTMVKLLEYMAMSKPVVAYDLRETRKVAADAALYATADDPVSLAQGIDELLDDPERRARMGAVGRERIETVLSWEIARQNLLAAYERAYAVADARRSRHEANRT
jgi:glycosyltransferase involved in cell wall biosynthesis